MYIIYMKSFNVDGKKNHTSNTAGLMGKRFRSISSQTYTWTRQTITLQKDKRIYTEKRRYNRQDINKQVCVIGRNS